MCKELNQFDNIYTAECMSVTEDFATVEDFRPMTAVQLQAMWDMGWQLMYAPISMSTGKSNPVYIHTFRKHKVFV